MLTVRNGYQNANNMKRIYSYWNAGIGVHKRILSEDK